MHKLYLLMFSVFVLLFTLLNPQYLYAASPNVVISQIKVGNSATSRLIEIYNNSDTAIDITDWCLYYSSPSNTSPYTSLACFIDPNPTIHMFINARSSALLASSQTGLLADIELTSGLGSGTSGHVYLMDSAGNEVDRVGWGTAVNAESNHPIIVNSTKVIERKQSTIPGELIDTDDNESDFINSILRSEYHYGSIYEVVDVCDNIGGIQEVTPIGYEIDANGDCLVPQVDACSNIDGLQTEPPINYEVDLVGDCVQHDECPNLSGIQTYIPDGYKLDIDNTCILDLLPLEITELLPNAVGNDIGNEFIELYNPNSIDIELSNYILYVGIDDVDYYSFPAGPHIGPGQYLAFSNIDVNFTLLNTSSSVRLMSADYIIIDEAPIYNSPQDGIAWALIDGLWQYTNRPTPNLQNEVSIIVPEVNNEVEEVAVSNLEPCAANQYRNPETNRCKLIVSNEPTLVACKDGQYRSEETNRCRNIASDVAVLLPCAEGQERNPDTNRCRSVTLAAVLGDNDLVPCKKGQERNPETNRCRNIASTMPLAEYAPEQTNEVSNSYYGWIVLASVGAIAVLYGVWEWRREIINLVQKFKLFSRVSK